MPSPKIEIDSAGIAELLKSGAVADAVLGAALNVEANLSPILSDGSLAETGTDTYTSDRAVAVVGILHPAGLRLQAKHGTLTRAASAAGLEVKARARA